MVKMFLKFMRLTKIVKRDYYLGTVMFNLLFQFFLGYNMIFFWQCALLLSKMPEEVVGKGLEMERIYDAVNVILSLQSDNGGFPAWEPNEAPRWLEVKHLTKYAFPMSNLRNA